MSRGSVVQYSRCECLEVVGIPSSANIKDLEGKVCTTFNIIGVVVKPNDIEASHSVYNDKKQLSNFQNVKSVNKFVVLLLRKYYSHCFNISHDSFL